MTPMEKVFPPHEISQAADFQFPQSSYKPHKAAILQGKQ